MAEFSMPFNATPSKDREYHAQDFARYVGSAFTSGLIHPYKQPELKVSLLGGMDTVLAEGEAYIEGHYYENTTPKTLMHLNADPTYNRIDRIVLRLDLTHNGLEILSHVKIGHPAATPQPPALARNDEVYELSLAQVLVRANTIQINAADITDERHDEDVCGPSRLKPEIPPQQIFDVMDAWFNDPARDDVLLRSDMGIAGGVTSYNDFIQHRNLIASAANSGHLKIGDGVTVINGVLQAKNFKLVKFETPGTFTWKVPADVKQVFVSGAAGGGAGGGPQGKGGSGGVSSFGSMLSLSGGEGGYSGANGPGGQRGGIYSTGGEKRASATFGRTAPGGNLFAPAAIPIWNSVDKGPYGAGGGGGPNSGGGGGGGDSRLDVPVTVTPSTNITIRVGAGGKAHVYNSDDGFNGYDGFIEIKYSSAY